MKSADASAADTPCIEAIMNPQKNSFRNVFQHNFQPSTTLLRVLSPSRWTKTFLKITGTI